MKKIVRVVWISLLTGMAFLVACTCQNRLPRAQRNELKKEREAVTQQIDSLRNLAEQSEDLKEVYRLRDEELQLRDRLSLIANDLKDQKAFDQNAEEIDSVRREMARLKNLIRRQDTPPCVYGPPR